jgi:hypothetical protein
LRQPFTFRLFCFQIRDSDSGDGEEATRVRGRKDQGSLTDEDKNSIDQKHRNTTDQKHRNTKDQKHRRTRDQKYKNTKDQKCKNSRDQEWFKSSLVKGIATKQSNKLTKLLVGLKHFCFRLKF